MSALLPGQRLAIADATDLIIEFGGRDRSRIAVAVFAPTGKTLALDQAGEGRWHLPSLDRLGERYELVAYITDDRQGGFVNTAYPCVMSIASSSWEFPTPTDQLAAIILAEIYLKDGNRRLRVSNEGYTFGIDAYARARNLGQGPIPHRSQPGHNRQEPDRGAQSRARRGQPLGSGSGVIVGPNLVVTNAHVIADGHSFELGRTRQALHPLAVDHAHDLALLQGPVSDAALPLRITAPIWLGEQLLAAGYPLLEVLGADLKVTGGNVSGLTGAGGDVSRFQFSAPIGSGSSGGAIVDEAGNLIGITAAALAHDNMRERGSISENVNFGVRAALVFELIAAAGLAPPPLANADHLHGGVNRREVTNRLRDAVVSILVAG
jgi:S1-C subfamily serine protease